MSIFIRNVCSNNCQLYESNYILLCKRVFMNKYHNVMVSGFIEKVDRLIKGTWTYSTLVKFGIVL